MTFGDPFEDSGVVVKTGVLPTGLPLSAKKRSYPRTGLACISYSHPPSVFPEHRSLVCRVTDH